MPGLTGRKKFHGSDIEEDWSFNPRYSNVDGNTFRDLKRDAALGISDV